MSEITRKVAAVVLTLALAFTVVGPVTAETTPTIEDLQAQIDELTALVASLTAQLAEPAEPAEPEAPAVGVPAACEGISFTRNLSLGVTGNDVKCLQALLNADGTPVAVTGVGSQGAETIHFGPLTRAAVIAFQNKYASEVLAPIGLTTGTGFVGTQTRAKLNAMLVAAPADPGIEEGIEERIEEGVEEGTEERTEEEVEEVGTPGVEGDLSAKLLSTPRDVNVSWGASNVAVMAIELEANDSDINVQRIDIHFNKEMPQRYINHIAIYDGENAVQGMNVTSANVRELTTATSRVRFTGLNINVPKDTEKVLTIKVGTDARPLDVGPVEITKINIRGVDEAKINQFADVTDDRTFTIEGTVNIGKVEVKLNANSPKEGIAITETADRTKHEVLRTDLVVTEDNVEVRNLAFNVTTNVATTSIVNFELYDGKTLLDTEGVPAGATTPFNIIFDDLRLDIEKGSTKTLTLKVEVDEKVDNVNLKANFLKTEDKTVIRSANGDTLGVADITGAASGETIHFFLVAPMISNISQSIVGVDHPTSGFEFADARITFTLTAQGGDVVLSTSGITLKAEGNTTTTAELVTVDGNNLGTESRTILSGQSEVVVAVARITTTGTNERTWLYVDSIAWDGGTIASGNDLLDDLKTGSIIITK